jgi:uncharacterized OB-fold protein
VSPTKSEPRPTPETQPFWDGCASGELRLQHCEPCASFYFPPRPFCPRCLSDQVEWRTLSGRGRLHTYLINHRPAPGFEEDAPYAIAVVELEEGPRMMSNIVGIENTPENLVLDMPLQVSFEKRGSVMLPLFTPAENAGADA